MPQKFFEDIIGTLSHNAGVISLNPSRLTIGGQQYATAALTRTISADVTMTANSLYMIFAVVSGGVVSLRISSNFNSVGPSGFNAWKLVGAFYADGMSPVAFGSFVTIEGSPETYNAVPYLPAFEATVTNPNLGTTGVREGYWARRGTRVHLDVKFVAGGTGISAGSGSYRTPVPFAYGSNNLGATGQYLTAQVGRGFGTVPSTAINVTAFRSGNYIYWYQSDGGISNGEFSNTTPTSAFTAAGNSVTTKAEYETSAWVAVPLKDL